MQNSKRILWGFFSGGGGNSGEKLLVRGYFFSIYIALLLHPLVAYVSNTVLNPLT